jgi:hypothetical protein
VELHERQAGKSVLGKRKADESSGGLQRAVKKLILDAQAVSPGSAGTHQLTPISDGSGISPSQGDKVAGYDSSTGFAGIPGAPPSNTDFTAMFMQGQQQQMPSFPMGVSAAAMPGNVPPQGQGFHQLTQDNNGNFDVSLESMLATYLPNTNQQTGPDDFMNRVFSVSVQAESGGIRLSRAYCNIVVPGPPYSSAGMAILRTVTLAAPASTIRRCNRTSMVAAGWDNQLDCQACIPIASAICTVRDIFVDNGY